MINNISLDVRESIYDDDASYDQGTTSDFYTIVSSLDIVVHGAHEARTMNLDVVIRSSTTFTIRENSSRFYDRHLLNMNVVCPRCLSSSSTYQNKIDKKSKNGCPASTRTVFPIWRGVSHTPNQWLHEVLHEWVSLTVDCYFYRDSRFHGFTTAANIYGDIQQHILHIHPEQEALFETPINIYKYPSLQHLCINIIGFSTSTITRENQQWTSSSCPTNTWKCLRRLGK